MIPVVDLEQRFGLGHGRHDKASRIVVLDAGSHTLGMVVDSVSEVLRVQSLAIEPRSPAVTTAESDYIR